jgi:geranylgeranyl diphosphate synthase type II
VSSPLQLKAYARIIDARMEQLLPSDQTEPSRLHEAMRFSCLLPGKRLRPSLLMASAEALGTPGTEVVDAACAVEFVHCFSLIHDDLPAIDNDDLRRGAPTLHVKFGEAIAILAGDSLFALAFQSLAVSAHPPDRLVAAIRVLTVASGSEGLVGGEVLDVLSEGKAVDSQTLDMIHSRKTGSLISASCEIGGILAGGTPIQIDALSACGRHLGLAFQIADDVLNETADSGQLGKAAGSDKAREKATYPALFGIERSRELAAEQSAAARASLHQAGIQSKFLHEMAEFAVSRSN